MTPRVCANCWYVVLLSGDADSPIPGLCRLNPQWVYVQDCRNHSCGQLEMSSEPPFSVPDETIEEGDADGVQA